MRLEPLSVGTSIVPPRMASGMVTGHLHLQVRAAPLEQRRVRHPGDHVEVPGRAAATAGLALAGEPHAAALAHPGRHVDLVALDLAGLAGAVAGGAWVGDLGAGAAALRGTAGRSRTGPATRPRPRGPGSGCRPGAWCPAWRRSRGRWGRARTSGTLTGTCAPSIAWSKEMCTSVSRSRPRSGARRPRAAPAPRHRRRGRRGCRRSRRRSRRPRRGTRRGRSRLRRRCRRPSRTALRFSGSERIP